MTAADKQAECLRICGAGVTAETHRIAPEICPFALDQWHNPKLRQEAKKEERK